jgi:hypothetical protein
MMTETEEDLRRSLAAAQSDALRVGDSPLRADRVAAQLQRIVDRVPRAGLDEDRAARMIGFLENALRVLRRDDDGREAAKHISSALGLLGPEPRRPSPFLDS